MTRLMTTPHTGRGTRSAAAISADARLRILLALAGLGAVLLCSHPAGFGGTDAPKEETVKSRSREYEVKVIPPVQPDADGEKSRGILKKKDDPAETVKFSFDNVPRRVFVSDNGEVVTVGEYPAEASVAIYNSSGLLVKHYAVDQILTPEEMAYISSRERMEGAHYSLYGNPEDFDVFRAYKRNFERPGMIRTAYRLMHPFDGTRNYKPEFKFSKDGSEFLLKTGWGRLIRFDLHTGEEKPQQP